jgi:hypothetical protein
MTTPLRNFQDGITLRFTEQNIAKNGWLQVNKLLAARNCSQKELSMLKTEQNFLII